jgi:hypothetical protein
VKSKKTDSQPSPWRHRAMVAAAGLGAAGLAAATIIGARPALRKQFLAEMKALGKGGGHALERQSSLPQQAVDQARQVALTLRAQGIDPATARIAVSGTGGTGKTTLTRALSQELGMKPLMMDDVGKSMSGRDLVSWVKKNPIQRGVIAEQTHLLSQVDPDKFDAVIRIHKPMSLVKKQILDRGRGAAQLEGYDYDKLNRSISTAFENLGAEKITPVTGIDIKIKPSSGFGADQLLRAQAQAKGVKTDGLSRHGLVLAAANGKRPVGGGVIPYFRKGRMAAGAGVVGGAGVGGAALANRIGQRSGVEKSASDKGERTPWQRMNGVQKAISLSAIGASTASIASEAKSILKGGDSSKVRNALMLSLPASIAANEIIHRARGKGTLFGKEKKS